MDKLITILLFLIVRPTLKILSKRILCSGTHLTSGPLLSDKLASKEKNRLTQSIIEHVKEMGKELNVDNIIINYPSIINEEKSLDKFGYYPLKHFGFKESNSVTMIKNVNC